MRQQLLGALQLIKLQTFFVTFYSVPFLIDVHIGPSPHPQSPSSSTPPARRRGARRRKTSGGWVAGPPTLTSCCATRPASRPLPSSSARSSATRTFSSGAPASATGGWTGALSAGGSHRILLGMQSRLLFHNRKRESIINCFYRVYRTFFLGDCSYIDHIESVFFQCCGSESGSTCFWASWIRIH
jgi:hypothetical protein